MLPLMLRANVTYRGVADPLPEPALGVASDSASAVVPEGASRLEPVLVAKVVIAHLRSPSSTVQARPDQPQETSGSALTERSSW